MSSEVAATSTGITVTELIDAFLLECDREYPPREGKRNTELACIESALFSLHRLYGPTLAEAFKPVCLDTVVRDYIARGFCRKMVNRYLSYCKRLFKWGVRHEHISGETFYKLLTVEGLRKGRSSARDNPQVHPVEEAIVEATLSYLSEEVAAMVRLQLLTGMRSGEVTRLRPCDLDRSGVVWRYSLEKHKTAHHGIMRQVPLGPKAQAIITPFLTADPMAYLFSPARAEAKRRAKMHEQRRTPLSCGNVPGSNRKERPRRVPGERYDSDSYGKAIRRGCQKAFPFPQTLLPDTRQWKSDRKANFIAVNGQETFDAHHAKVMEWYKRHFWHPHQLRHTASTRVARTFGEIASQNLLGHSSLKTTAIYTERDWRKAEEVMAAVG
jgi:integrase